MRGSRLAAPAALLLVATGCSLLDGEPNTDGPLVVSDRYDWTVAAPDTRPWRASFGDYYVCDMRAAGDIRLTSVRVHSKVEPRSVTVYFRNVTREVGKAAGGGEKLGSIDGLYGGPPAFDPPYAFPHDPVYGDFTTDLDSVPLAKDCYDGPTLQELVLTVEAGSEGAHVTGLEVDYTSGGKDYRAKTETDVELCGTKVTKNCAD